MKSLNLLFLFLILSFLSSIAFAAPTICPDTSAIIGKGLISAALPTKQSGTFVASQQDKYNTSDNWYFSITVFGAASEQDALGKANTALTTLTGKPLPIILGGQLSCVYGINGPMMAVATASYNGVGYYCESYSSDSNMNDWSFKNCQKVIYNPKGYPVGVQEEKIDLNFVFCPAYTYGFEKYENLIMDKKKYPYYYAYSGDGGAPMPGGDVFSGIYILNDKSLAEGTKMDEITICIHGIGYGLNNCRILN